MGVFHSPSVLGCASMLSKFIPATAPYVSIAGGERCCDRIAGRGWAVRRGACTNALDRTATHTPKECSNALTPSAKHPSEHPPKTKSDLLSQVAFVVPPESLNHSVNSQCFNYL